MNTPRWQRGHLVTTAALALLGCSSESGEDRAPEAAAELAAAPACTPRRGGPGDRVLRVSSGGVSRTARVHVPRGYDGGAATPVVLAFHAYLSDAVQMELYTGLSGLADEETFIVVYPQGLFNSWNAGACCGEAARRDADDVAFVAATLDALEAELCVDTKRIFATGMSNGGFFTHRLGCELAPRIAAIAPVAGVNAWPRCAPSRPVPLLQIHGTLDTVVPYGGNLLAGFPSVFASTDAWAERNGCSEATRVTQPAVDTTCRARSECTGASTLLCSIRGGGHAWPGGLPLPGVYTSPWYRASREVWRFFQAHPLP